LSKQEELEMLKILLEDFNEEVRQESKLLKDEDLDNSSASATRDSWSICT
jgi:hypothetical protein